MKAVFRYLPMVALAAFVAEGCMKHAVPSPEDVVATGSRGLFVVCEGNYTYSNASLSYYDIDAMKVENEVFVRRNSFPLGDVAQSMTIHDGTAYVAVNNSSVVFTVDPETFRCTGRIENLVSPRYVHIVDDSKAYISDMYAFEITVFDPRTRLKTGSVSTRFEGRKRPSTEQMIGYGGYVFTNCWSYDDRMLVIDAAEDEVVGSIATGKQPNSMALDRNGKIWVLSDGGYGDNPVGHEAPSLRRIDAETRQVEKVFEFETGQRAADICIDGTGSTIYILKDHVWRMDVGADDFPAVPFIENTTGNYWYGIAADPRTSEIYLADAVDKVQPGVVYRYSPQGALVDKFKVGVIPGDFCFYSRGDGL